MDNLILSFVILITGFLASVSSIILWSRTRNPSWLFMVLGIIFLYIYNILEILKKFGFMYNEILLLGGLELLPIIFASLPFVFFFIGTLIYIIKSR